MRKTLHQESSFTDKIALKFFREMLRVGIPFPDMVRFLLRHKSDRTIKQVANEIGFDETSIHKYLSGDRRHFEYLSSLLMSYLGFDPFAEAESLLGKPVYRNLHGTGRMRPHVQPPGLAPDTGRAFLAWVRQGIQSGDLELNRSLVHIVPAGVLLKGVFLVSPAIFEAHLKVIDSKSSARVPKFRIRYLQSLVEKTGANIKTQRQTNIHSVKDRESKSVLNGFLFPVEVFFKPGEHPPFNQNLT